MHVINAILAHTNCNTFGTANSVAVDEGYLMGYSSNIPLPVTQWVPYSTGGKAYFGALDIYFGRC